ncbi:Hypothetical protein Trvi_ORF62 [Trabala vishnou gigantina nucleopolyhedrovirus]|uniref:Hypothetical protein n=1 Tax=Trabala vishnou gigantina nucleopolyhedrovirus TaxID=2863583 RepID=UPI002481C7EE|nr:Hypothetical protein QKU87_gp062 [Trabala vishnou gigantina nucleopolyhedrovirus]QYC92755.1 Hypothetical protein Trvi_ORF62 [Trabala vishnou gigantina nucleopolyhedrovirus]
MYSKLKNAKRLQMWLLEEVFPAIDNVTMKQIQQKLSEPVESTMGTVYIATTDLYFKSSLFKIGKTTNIKNRLVQLNCGRAKFDQLKLVCHTLQNINYGKMETMLKEKLLSYQDHGEIYNVPLAFLLNVLNDVCNLFLTKISYDIINS